MHRLHAYVVLGMLAALSPGGSPHASAQSAPAPEALQAANELMAILAKEATRQIAAGMSNQIWPSIERAIRNKHKDLDQKALSELRAELERIQLQYVTIAMSDVPAIYARHFTVEELRDMAAFYRTPAGQKSIDLLPRMMSEAMATIMPKIQDMQAEILAAFSRALRQRGIDL